MLRKLKFLGLAGIMALSLAALTAGAAAGDTFTAEKYPVTLTGDQDGQIDQFTTQAGVTKCNTITYVGTVTGPTTTLTLFPTYSGCSQLGLTSTIDMNGCDYLFHINSAAGNTTATTDIVCPAGKEITKTTPSIGTPKCITHIPPQTGLEVASFTNIGSGTTREITIDLHLEKIKYTQTRGTAETGNCETRDSQADGTYIGKIRLTGEEDNSPFSHVGIFLS